MDEKLFNELCPECQGKCVEMGEEPEASEEAMMGKDEDGMPSKKPLKTLDEAEDRGLMRIMAGLNKGAGKGRMNSKFKDAAEEEE